MRDNRNDPTSWAIICHGDPAIYALIAIALFCIAWASAVTKANALDVAPILWRLEYHISAWHEGLEHALRDKCFADGGDWISITEDHQNEKVEVFCHQRIDRRPKA